MKDRIILLIKAKNFTAAQFADEVGVQKSGISHIISGRNNPSLDFVQKILYRFPEVNMEWLIMGKGPMFTGAASQPSVSGTTLFPLPGGDIAESDLFTAEIRSAFKPKEAIVTDDIQLSNPAEVTGEPEKERFEKPQSEKMDTKNPAMIFVPLAGNEKKIVKTVFYYSDRTFVEYYPEA